MSASHFFSCPHLLLPWNGCRIPTMVVIPGHLGRQSLTRRCLAMNLHNYRPQSIALLLRQRGGQEWCVCEGGRRKRFGVIGGRRRERSGLWLGFF
jgi:hypothetical protein